MKRAFTLILAVCLIMLPLTGCSLANLGVYSAESMMGLSVPSWDDDFQFDIELKLGGRFDAVYEGDTISGEWRTSGDNITLVVDGTGANINGTLQDGKMTIDFGGMEVVLRKR